jgi:hypothetical protein
MLSKASVLMKVLASIFLFVAACYADEAGPAKPKFFLRLAGGGSFVRLGDIRENQVIFNELLLSEAARAYSVDSSSILGQRIFLWEAEVRLDLTQHLGIGFSVSSPLELSTGSSVPLYYPFGQAGDPPSGAYAESSFIKVNAPLRLNVYYTLPVFPAVNIVGYGGVGYYSGRMRGSSDFEVDDADGYIWVRSSWTTAPGSAFGFQGGLGIEFMLNRRVSVILETQYAVAQIDDFNALMDAASNAWPAFFYVNSQGKLYQWAWGSLSPVGNGLAYSEFMVWEGAPPTLDYGSGTSYSKAKLDLGGISLRIGIRFGIF